MKASNMSFHSLRNRLAILASLFIFSLNFELSYDTIEITHLLAKYQSLCNKRTTITINLHIQKEMKKDGCQKDWEEQFSKGIGQQLPPLQLAIWPGNPIRSYYTRATLIVLFE